MEKIKVTYLLQARPAGLEAHPSGDSCLPLVQGSAARGRQTACGALFLQLLPVAPGSPGLPLAPGESALSSRDTIQQGTVQQTAPALPGILNMFFCFPGQNNGRAAGLKSF